MLHNHMIYILHATRCRLCNVARHFIEDETHMFLALCYRRRRGE